MNNTDIMRQLMINNRKRKRMAEAKKAMLTYKLKREQALGFYQQ